MHFSDGDDLVRGEELLGFVAGLHVVISISVPFSPVRVLPLLSGFAFSSLRKLKQHIPSAFRYLPCCYCWWSFVFFVTVQLKTFCSCFLSLCRSGLFWCWAVPLIWGVWRIVFFAYHSLLPFSLGFLWIPKIACTVCITVYILCGHMELQVIFCLTLSDLFGEE